jgi:hypothetical protein
MTIKQTKRAAGDPAITVGAVRVAGATVGQVLKHDGTEFVPAAEGVTAEYIDFKASVRAATTANITLSGTQTVDGVALIANDRVLVKNQSTGSQNGLYVVQAGAWIRTTDADVSAEVTPGMFVFVEEGTINGDTGWLLSTNAPITLGTTSLTFLQFAADDAKFVHIAGTETVTGAKTFATTVRIGSAFTNFPLVGDEALILEGARGIAFDGGNDDLWKVASWFDALLTLGDATNPNELAVASGANLKLNATTYASVFTAGSERVRIDANGALLLGSTAVLATSLGAHLGLGPQGTALTRNNANNAWLNIFAFTANDDCNLSDGNVRDLDVRCGRFLKFTVDSERARIDESGTLLVGTTATGPGAAGVGLANNASLYGRGAAGGWTNLVKLNTDDDVEIGNDVPVVLKSGGGAFTFDGYFEMGEMPAPAAPAANKARLYAEDNGSGKTKLMVRFPTGAAVQIAIEP